MASASNALPLDVDSSRSRSESARRWEGIVGGGPQVSSRGPSSSPDYYYSSFRPRFSTR